jgi:flagellar biosynthesis GTPase FlhF
VLSGDMISLKVRPEVSALDFSNAITLEGFRVPALSTRRTETEVELQDGQTFAIAGLMNNTLNSTMSKIPGIGDIPVLGYLFRSRAYQKQQTELVVMITPQIVRRGSTGVSEGLPSLVEPYMGAPSKTMNPPAPYVGSPRYPVTQSRTGGGSQNQPQPQKQEPTPAPSQPEAAAPSQPAPAADAPSQPADPQPKAMTKEEKRQAEAAAKQQAEAEKKAAEEKAEADKKAAEQKAEADKKAAKEKERQQKLDQERAKREAEVARKNAEAERKKQEEQKKKEKSLADAAQRLREAQAAYQAEVARTAPTSASAKPGGGGK